MKKTDMAAKAEPARNRKAAGSKTTKLTAEAKKKVTLPLYCGRKNPFTPEAWEYVNREDLWSGTEKPLCFIHPTLVFDIANAQARPLDLEQVKILVYPEGPKVEMCALLNAREEEKFFTPLNYAYAISPKGLAQIEAGTPFAEVKGFFRGGPYYVNKAKTEAKAFSGSPLRFKISRQGYWRNDGAALVIMAVEKGDQKRPVWGIPFSEIEKMIQAQSRKTELHTLASQMAMNLTNGRRDDRDRDSWNRVGDHEFKRAKHKDRPRDKQHPTEVVE